MSTENIRFHFTFLPPRPRNLNLLTLLNNPKAPPRPNQPIRTMTIYIVLRKITFDS